MEKFIRYFALSLVLQLIFSTLILHYNLYKTDYLKELFISIGAALVVTYFRRNKIMQNQ